MGFFDKKEEEFVEEKAVPEFKYNDHIAAGQEFIKRYHFDVDVTGVFDEKTQKALAAFLDFQLKYNKTTIEKLESELLAEKPKPMLPRVMRCGLSCFDYELEINTGKWDEDVQAMFKDFQEANYRTSFVDAVKYMFYGV